MFYCHNSEELTRAYDVSEHNTNRRSPTHPCSPAHPQCTAFQAANTHACDPEHHGHHVCGTKAKRVSKWLLKAVGRAGGMMKSVGVSCFSLLVVC